MKGLLVSRHLPWMQAMVADVGENRRRKSFCFVGRRMYRDGVRLERTRLEIEPRVTDEEGT